MFRNTVYFKGLFLLVLLPGLVCCHKHWPGFHSDSSFISECRERIHQTSVSTLEEYQSFHTVADLIPHGGLLQHNVIIYTDEILMRRFAGFLRDHDVSFKQSESGQIRFPNQIGNENYNITIQVEMNDCIDRVARAYTGKRRRDLLKRLQYGQPYFSMIQSKLKNRCLPMDLLWIPVVESGFKLNARSNRAAVGMWQLMPATARVFDLQVNSWIDERKDPERSTDAALDALEYLSEKLHSWPLAFAAYNAGEGLIHRAVRKYKTHDYWLLAKQRALPSQTRHFVTAIMSLQHIYENQQKYGIDMIDHTFKNQETTLVPLTSQSDLRDLSRCAGIDIEELKDLNPALNKGWTPPDYPDFRLRIPAASRDRFLEAYLAKPPKIKDQLVSHEIKPGETLSHIAETYDSTVQDIMRINELKQTVIYAGNLLIIPMGTNL